MRPLACEGLGLILLRCVTSLIPSLYVFVLLRMSLPAFLTILYSLIPMLSLTPILVFSQSEPQPLT